MNSTSECHCGCEALIYPDDPSPDFKWPQCQKLWLASLDKDDPGRWRFEQRILDQLFRVAWSWTESQWDFEWTDVHLAFHDEHGDPDRGLANLYLYYDQSPAVRWRTSPLPVLTRPSPAPV